MADAPNRTPEQVTREIEREREQLATAVAHLRGELNVKSLLRGQTPKVVAGAAAIVGLKVLRTLAKRRSRTHAVESALGQERFSFGRFTLLERDDD